MSKKFKQDRKLWYRNFTKFLRIRYNKLEFKFLGEKPTNGAIILSNHNGAAAPVCLESYADFPIRIWGTHEMNEGFLKLYKYQTEIYYRQKRKWNIHLARLFCIIASPLTNLYYKGLRLISTYRDTRFLKKTIPESISVIESGSNIVIFPEDSSDGYHKELKAFHSGFTVLAQELFKRGIDVDIFVAYHKNREKQYIFDSPIKFSKLKEVCADRREMANYLLKRCNELGK